MILPPAEVSRNPNALLGKIAATNVRIDELNLVLDSDPRRVTKTGSAHSGAPGADPATDPTAYPATAAGAQQD
ncbi:MAG: hypothetical protein U5L98_18270 [Halomonas sp.]|uniref:hypothetical protein n=1 Tax=Halomonas sp. TaxID=1486246 RepID=UPI002ACEC85E|nr:hypothetical protein [Halomonas sp.]MDZ7854520.1 hypothetical protein [Halomonas sp.]